MTGTPETLVTHSWRLLNDVGVARTGTEQMEADVGLLDDVEAGAPPTLRLYTWDTPTLSIGHFQPLDDIDTAACVRHGVDVVTRPTGGAALLHGGDLTYAVAMPIARARRSVQVIYDDIASALIAGLARLGVEATVARAHGERGAVCFAAQVGADLRVGRRKVCGSAQVRRRELVLQHGSILLRRLPIDETDLVTGSRDRAQLRRSTVTLSELDAPSDARAVADVLISGFEAEFGISFQ